MTNVDDFAARMKRVAQQVGEACSWFVTDHPLAPEESDIFACFFAHERALAYARMVAGDDKEREWDKGDGRWCILRQGKSGVFVNPMSDFHRERAQ